jgi:hypothetical protein
MSRHRARFLIGVAAAFVAFVPAISAQHPAVAPGPKAKPESVTVVAGAL